MKDLALWRGERRVAEGLSFTVPGGQALVLTGPNGSGKTTLLRGLAGLLKPRSGSISLEGTDDELSVGEQCHFVGHLNAIKPQVSVAANLAFWSGFLAGRGLDAAASNTILARLGLTGLGDIPAGYLSAGQKRRVCLARLLTASRPVWILDEPSTSLDASGQQMLAGLLREHMSGGGIAVVATHIPLGLEGAAVLDMGARR